MDGAIQHLEHRDVSFVVVSRAPFDEIDPFPKRMGWKFKWVSSYDSDFNYDYHVSFKKDSGKVYYNFEKQDFQIEESSGTSVFYRDPEDRCFTPTPATLAGAIYFLAPTITSISRPRAATKTDRTIPWRIGSATMTATIAADSCSRQADSWPLSRTLRANALPSGRD